MTQGWLVVPVSIVYLSLLFLVAYLGDRQKVKRLSWQPLIYSFSIAVYCTSWSFYGTVGQAATDFWSFVPIYLGPILVFTLGWKTVRRVILISKRERITSIADFIAARYGKSQKLAMVITLIAVVGVLPYIALQLRAIVMGLDLLAGPGLLAEGVSARSSILALLVSLALAIFAILFGTRNIDITEHHRGMMIAIAFESLLKLLAFVAVGGFALYVLFTAPPQLTAPVFSNFTATAQDFSFVKGLEMFLLTVLAMCAMICLPRQFHVTVVENSQEQDLKWARWLFPLYLSILGFFVLPLAMAGDLTLGMFHSPDTYVISLPMALDQPGLALAAFLGGTSAASGMVIVSSIALAIMVSNDLVLPFLLRSRKLEQGTFIEFKTLLIKVRRTTIVAILLLSWGSLLILEQVESLATIGFLSLAAIAQFAPALILGLYWRRGNRKGVYLGLLFGVSIWLLTLLQETALVTFDRQSFYYWLLSPPEFAGLSEMSGSSWGILLSLTFNLTGYLVGSWLSSPALSERMQASNFVGQLEHNQASYYRAKVRVEELKMLAERFMGQRRVQWHFERYAKSNAVTLTPDMLAPGELIEFTERLLAGVFGTASARLVMSSALQGREMQLDELATIVDEASELFQFNRGLLQGAIEHINQGISVVDNQLKLVAWNRRYLELFSYPNGLIRVGRPIDEIIRYNALRGLCGEGGLEEQINRRVSHMKKGTPHISSRKRSDGRVIQVQGNPMPGGGFVMSCTDITPFIQAEQVLKETNETLEARVEERTKELSLLNQQLLTAKQQSETANASKTRFLAAVSHDLMQPLNAAKLFTSSMREIATEGEVGKIAKHIDDSLTAAEDLISDLLDISRLEAGKLPSKKTHFKVSQVLDMLAAEFQVLAREHGHQFKVIGSQAVVYTDARLLRRILQNFLTNALRYNPKGRVLLGLRRTGANIRLEVWDNGPGIPADKLSDIFEEFKRLDHSKTAQEQGLGLGLAIAKGLAQILDHQLEVRSWPDRGTVFSVCVSKGQSDAIAVGAGKSKPQMMFQGVKVLCIDNEPDILTAMESLLSRWGCEVVCADKLDLAEEILCDGWLPELILTDYHLGEGKTGLQALLLLKLSYGAIPAVVISADRQASVLSTIKEHGYAYLSKPVKPLKLRALINSLLKEKKSIASL